MLKQQARSALEGYFDVTLTQLAERHPFTYAGVNEDGCVDIFIYYVEPNEEVIHLDLAILSHARWSQWCDPQALHSRLQSRPEFAL
ncbi:hypothetical protein [Aeromonas sp. 700377]|uniref:hypothetical protein n=1 Tax=Aeromonas sp. 700377 TaxID=2712056 RepID=UPI003B9F6FB4